MTKEEYNIYRHKDGNWEGRYIKGFYNDGEILYGYVYAKTYSEVESKLMNLKGSSDTNGSNTTFKEIAIRWLSCTSIRVKSSTYANYKRMLETHILPIIGDYIIYTLTSYDIEVFTKDKLLAGRKDGLGGLSPKTVRDILSIIKSIIDFASKENLEIQPISITYPKYQQRDMRVLSKQEQVALENVLLHNINLYKLGILLCLYTGLRIGELCALRWQDISVDKKILYVRQNVQRIKNNDLSNKNKTYILIQTPKSKSSLRDIPIPNFILPYLLYFPQKDKVYILSGIEEQPIEPRTMQNYFKRYINEANIDSANFHSLRHTFATRCIEAGVDVKSLSEILGHANVNITLNRYVHSSIEQKQKCINKLEQYMELNK